MKTKKHFLIPLLLVVSCLAVFALGFTSNSFFRNVDDIDLPFEEDTRVIGKWEAVDFVKEVEDFDPEEQYWKNDLFITSLVFIKNGKMLSAISNGNLAYTTFRWTKGMIVNQQDKTASQCIIKEYGDTQYMFFEWKSGDYIFQNMKPNYYVLKKTDDDDYSDYKVSTIEDDTNYPFVEDVDMKGIWETVDFVKTIDTFNPKSMKWIDTLYLLKLNFKDDGKLIATTTSGEYSDRSITWTKGLVLNKSNKTASQCEIQEIDGKTYMFYQWKSGDYIFRGMEPYYYVLRKVE